ncbi:uncharacterized protein LOC114156256 isoform X3 [Xiphophorus couchianus]|uniref:uncharacterized protein LOC114156256 isoform X3 n=1 Tax=Xiphophorus couchianus TaxID=32473 RepID=UPI001015F997|nr:uncharacterized protein LOC114156256 isoform X3 [Xiphophorus couchianus]
MAFLNIFRRLDMNTLRPLTGRPSEDVSQPSRDRPSWINMSEQGGGDLPKPKIEQLMAKLRMLQQDASSKLQLQCEDSEQDLNRQLKQNKTSEELLEHYRCEIEEVKLKHRKLRIRFENQLMQLIEQHKQLDYVFNSKRLPDELKKGEDIKHQLSSAEQVKLAQLHKLDEELEEAKKQKQFETEDAQIHE